MLSKKWRSLSAPATSFTVKLCRNCSSIRKLSPQTVGDAHTYCFDLVKTHDYEHFLAGLLIPKRHRDVYFTLRAFNIEIATIKDQIPRNNANAGRIRFQFWKDVLHQIYEHDHDHSHDVYRNTLSSSINQPVALALQYHINNSKLTKRWFERMIESRFSDMMNPATFETMDDLETYAELSHSSMYYLFLEAILAADAPTGPTGPSSTTAGDEAQENSHMQSVKDLEFALSHIGVCKGILTLLRGHHHHMSQGNCYFPQDVMQQFGLTPRMAADMCNYELGSTVSSSGDTTESVMMCNKDVVNDIASQAHAHLTRARELANDIVNIRGGDSLPKDAVFALLPAIGSSIYLETLNRNDFALKVEGETESRLYFLKLQFRLLLFLLRKKF